MATRARYGHRRVTLLAALSFVQVGCGEVSISPVAQVAASTVSLQGTATYSEPIQLPADATLEVLIEDVSRADARAEVIARTVSQPGSLPADFVVEFLPDRLQPGHRYNVRARVEQQGRLLFITDTHNELPQAPGAARLELKLARTGVSAASTAQLENTYWKLLALGAMPVSTPEGQREARLVLQRDREGTQRAAGFGGCNAFTGHYTLDGDRIAFTEVAATMMACAQGMETEQAFHAALARATRWSIRGEQLELFDAGGARVALFESVYLR